MDNDKEQAAQPSFVRPNKWTLLLTGDNYGLVGERGMKWEGHPEHYERVDVVAESEVSRCRAQGGDTILERYDAGYLNGYGGGDVNWWQDYLRAELDRAYDFYQSQADNFSIPTAVSTKEAARSDALHAVRRLIDGSQPKDIPGAIMVIDSAIAGRTWTYDISPPPGFIDYIKANYTGDVFFDDPEWHALRLWNAAMRNVKITAPAATSTKLSTNDNEKGAE